MSRIMTLIDEMGDMHFELQQENTELKAMLREIVDDAKSYENRTGKKVSWVTKASKLLGDGNG